VRKIKALKLWKKYEFKNIEVGMSGLEDYLN